MVDKDDTQRMTYDRQPITPQVWHKLSIGEQKICTSEKAAS